MLKMCALCTLANQTNGLDDRRPCIFMPYFSFLRRCVCLRIILYAGWLPAALCLPFRLFLLYLRHEVHVRTGLIPSFVTTLRCFISHEVHVRAGLTPFLLLRLGLFISHEVHVRTGLIVFILPCFHYLPSSRSKFTRERGCCFRFIIVLSF